MINISFIWIGNPKYHLCLFLPELFSKFRHALLEKRDVFYHSGSIFGQYLTIFVNVCSYLLYPPPRQGPMAAWFIYICTHTYMDPTHS